MRRLRAAALLVCVMLMAGMAALGDAGEQRRALLKQYWGQIQSIKVDKCGLRPGLCEGAIVLTKREGGAVTLAIRPGTWIKRGDQLVLLEELRVWDDVHVQAAEIAGATQATNIDVLTSP